MNTKQADIEKIQRLREAFFKYACHTERCLYSNSGNHNSGYSCICGLSEAHKQIIDDKMAEPYNHRTGHNLECECSKCKSS